MARPFFMPLFTNVLEREFPEVRIAPVHAPMRVPDSARLPWGIS
jgi:hypothetical protein